MEHAGLILASRALAACEIQVEKIKPGYRLHVEGESRSFRSSPTPSKAKADAARRAFEEFAEWSASSTEWITQAAENSELEMREEIAREVAEVIRKRAGKQIPEPEQEPAGEEKAKLPENRSQEQSEKPDPPAADEPGEHTRGQSGRTADVKERKDPEWRKEEVERILDALSQTKA